MKYFTLLQLNKSIQNLIHGIDRNFWITAEVAQFQLRDHAYLELVQKEEEQIVARSRAMVWASAFAKLRDKLGNGLFEILKEGTEILVQVKVTFHEVHGLSLNVLDLDEKYTIGALELKRQETLKRLQKEGLLSLQKEMFFPLVPQKIAIISSDEAAGYTDFIEQLHKNPYGFQFNTKLFSASVQGQKALSEITARLKEIEANDYDVIVLIRGGGSRLDLEVFNEYEIARGIAKVDIPVLTGIGHQRDETVSDVVSHISLKTPTAVAEFLIDKVYDYWSLINELFQEIAQLAKSKVDSANNKLVLLQQQMMGQAKLNLNSNSIRLFELQKSILSEVRHKLKKENNELGNLKRQINQLDPQRLLQRGYSITLKNGLPVNKENPASPNDEIESITSTGKILSKVLKANEKTS